MTKQQQCCLGCRQAGVAYQFRHIELQHRLAARRKEPSVQRWQKPCRRQRLAQGPKADGISRDPPGRPQQVLAIPATALATILARTIS